MLHSPYPYGFEYRRTRFLFIVLRRLPTTIAKRFTLFIFHQRIIDEVETYALVKRLQLRGA